MNTFDEYIRQNEPSRQERAYAWQTAIGLQAVDGLQPSEYLIDTARKHIEGEIDIDTAREQIRTYYQSKTNREPDDDEKHEADAVSANITKILSTRTLDFSRKGYIALHRRIFEGVFKLAGQIRDYDITKKEWVLDNDTVNYLNWEDLNRALDYDIEQERNFSYTGLSTDEIIAHITRFVSGLWQIHPFGEGNTRTTAVFAILYLRSIGFKVENDLFAHHSWYFRNALVRANYKNAILGIDYTPIYLERFFRNLLFGEQWDLHNRYLHINPSPEWASQPNLSKTEQEQDKHRTSTEQVPNKVENLVLTDNEDIRRLVSVIGNERKSVKEMLELLSLKHRPSFLENYLNPAIQQGYVAMLYPEKPQSPRQKYLLTVKGLTLLAALTKKTHI